jgi:hypothetical protein
VDVRRKPLCRVRFFIYARISYRELSYVLYKSMYNMSYVLFFICPMSCVNQCTRCPMSCGINVQDVLCPVESMYKMSHLCIDATPPRTSSCHTMLHNTASSSHAVARVGTYVQGPGRSPWHRQEKRAFAHGSSSGGSRKAYHNYPVEVGTVQYSTVQYNYMGNGRRDGAISREGATMRRTREGRGWEERFSSEGIYSVSLLQREYILSLSLCMEG